MKEYDKHYINGEWVASTGSETIDVISASTEEVIGRVPAGSAGDVDKAVAAAKAAFDSWSATRFARNGKGEESKEVQLFFTRAHLVGKVPQTTEVKSY